MSHESRSPWHSGERELQQRVGVAERMEIFGRKVIRDHMPEQHRNFYQQLPFAVVATVDSHGDPWVSLLESDTGLAHSPDPKTLHFNTLPRPGDPVRDGLTVGAAIGILGIELHSRRRNRVNGIIAARSEQGFSLHVGHAFGNCPQYIQHRAFSFAASTATPYRETVEQLNELDRSAREFIENADTFFLSSYVDLSAEESPDGHAHRQIDASHRGGKAGFVRVDGNTLTIPDFAGNLHFNTLGNLLLNPKAGLVFVDFETGDLLHVSGRTELIFDGPEVTNFQGAERAWRLHIQKIIRRPCALKLRWQLHEFSPNALMTGSWADAQARTLAYGLRHQWRRFRVSKIVDESSIIKSFYLVPTDGAGLPTFKAGQHLPIRLSMSTDAAPTIRTYTLSAAPSDGFYRISVKREGVVSSFLHDHFAIGSELDARAPQGDFVVDALARRPLVLLSAGVGITPMLAMLREVVYEGLRTRRVRKTFFISSARNLAVRAFNDEVLMLLQRGGNAIEAVRVLSAPEPSARQHHDYEVQGQIDLDLLKSILPLDDYDFYLCGPSAFTQSLYDGLRDLNIADERLHAEQFGPSTLLRRTDSKPEIVQIENPPAAEKPVPVLFTQSAKEARWQPGSGSLLELAEARGLSPEFSCRGGSCGTCKTKLIAGKVSYLTPPAMQLEGDEVLICCAVPAAGDGSGASEALVLEL